jgi:TPR repeat protein
LPSDGYAGDLNLQFMLFRRDDPAPEKNIVAFRIDPQKLQTAAVPDIAPEQATGALRTEPARQPVFTPARPARQLSEEAESAEMERAKQFLGNADIAAARLLYETLAMKGSARAAFAMGQTYDDRFLRKIQLQGLRPDAEEARKWYGLAIELGSTDAESWLAALN